MTQGGKQYIIPRNIRELQQREAFIGDIAEYIIPRNIRELQLNSANTTAAMKVYHSKKYKGTTTRYYTRAAGKLKYIIPRNIRELQQLEHDIKTVFQYIIPRNIRELQLLYLVGVSYSKYIIPRNIRELQRIVSGRVELSEVYHSKKYKGTTTNSVRSMRCP